MRKFIFWFGISAYGLGTPLYASSSWFAEEEEPQTYALVLKEGILQDSKNMVEILLESLKQELKYNETLTKPFLRAVPNRFGSLYDPLPAPHCNLIQNSNRRIHEYIVRLYCMTDKQENSAIKDIRSLWK
jgi:hypothetical protein